MIRSLDKHVKSGVSKWHIEHLVSSQYIRLAAKLREACSYVFLLCLDYLHPSSVILLHMYWLPVHLLILGKDEIIAGKRDAENDGGDSLKAVNPLLSLGALTSHIKHPVNMESTWRQRMSKHWGIYCKRFWQIWSEHDDELLLHKKMNDFFLKIWAAPNPPPSLISLWSQGTEPSAVW